MSIPFIASGITLGATRFAALATSMLAPTQRAAGTAAEEGTSGNFSLGNTNQNTHSFDTMRGNSYMTNTELLGGTTRMQMPNASMVNLTPDGTSTHEPGMAVSNIPTNINFANNIANSQRQAATEQRSLSDTQTTLAASSLTSAVNAGTSAVETISNDINSGAGWTETMTGDQRQAFNNLQNAAKDFSVGNDVTQTTALQMMLGVSADTSKSLLGKLPAWTLGVSGKADATGLNNNISQDTWKEARNFAEQRGLSEDISVAMNAAQQNSAHVTDREGNSFATQYYQNLTDAVSHSEQAAVSLNNSKTFEKMAAGTEENSAMINQNLSQPFVEYLQNQVVDGQLLGINGANDLLYSGNYKDQQTVAALAKDFVDSKFSSSSLPVDNLTNEYNADGATLRNFSNVDYHNSRAENMVWGYRSDTIPQPGEMRQKVDELGGNVDGQISNNQNKINQENVKSNKDDDVKADISKQAHKGAYNSFSSPDEIEMQDFYKDKSGMLGSLFGNTNAPPPPGPGPSDNFYKDKSGITENPFGDSNTPPPPGPRPPDNFYNPPSQNNIKEEGQAGENPDSNSVEQGSHSLPNKGNKK